jgi:squalene-hopene/tetraprenyl-beta-curcumene cyclase
MRTLLTAVLVVGFVGLGTPPALGQDPKPAPTAADLKPVLDKAVAFLRTTQNEDGSWSPQRGGPGITALIVTGLLRHGYGPNDPMVAKALTYLESKVQKDGGVYDKMLANYTTSIALMAFREANTDGRYDKVIENAVRFLKTLQYDEGRGFDPSRPEYGGTGYDAKSRPDLSNMQFFVEALHAAGVPPDDPALKRAVVFISRSQNLPGEHNDLEFAKKVAEEDRGGFIYSPVGGGQSRAGKTPAGGLRSDAVMTYAGLKSFLHAGVSKKDPRVQAAVRWIKAHYTLDENPGQGRSGLFYYYHTFAKAMDALGEGDVFVDAKGARHNWRADLFHALRIRQQANGSWANNDDRFYEGDPNLCTAYALLALSYCKPAK